MMNNSFSPVKSPESFVKALEYVAKNVGDLALEVCGERLPVPILKLFAQSATEYELVEQLVRRHGEKATVSSNNSFYVDVSSGLAIANTAVTLLGVRRPDPNKPQVGCGDCVINNFEGFTNKVMTLQPNHARRVENAHGLRMLEIWHPNFDVLGYLIPVE